MLRELRRRRRALFLALLTATTLAACGGGGDDDDEDTIEPPEDEDATGLWLGQFTQAGTSRTFSIMAAPNGQFVGLVSASAAGPTRLMVGTGDVTANIINGTGTVYAPVGATLSNGAATAALTIAAGRVTEGVSMTGNYSGGGETATFSLNFDPKTNRGASLATVAGVYSLTPVPTDPNVNATLTIQNVSGAATFATGAGCNGTGTVAVISPGLNMYTWTLNMGVCNTQPARTITGLATIGDPVGGTPNTLIVLVGASNDRGFVFAGTK